MIRIAVATYSLVHGAWHGGWCWDLLRATLESQGHTVHAPDLPCDDPRATIEDYAMLVPKCDVVVGHSLAGYTIPLVDARVRVYLCALVQGIEPEFVPGFGDTRTRDDLGRSYYPYWRDGARELQYPDEYAELAQRLRPQARIDDPGGDPPLGGVYVVCAQDACVAPAMQRRAAERFTRVELAAGHSPMLTHVPELTELLLDLVRRL